ncbi:MAG TPA: formyltransferase family protein [Baekduia sp.]|nr:formyltransferase family protein [Baekduia sp.]
MSVVFLGRDDSPVLAHLRSVEPATVALGAEAALAPALLAELEPQWVVSHGYRRILRRDVLDVLPDRIINLHIALLPYNRGADPTLWSVLEDTPAGVSIHHVDEGVDTGDVIAQRDVALTAGDTLATAYARLQEAMAALFVQTWPAIADGIAPRWPQPAGGTAHRVADRAAVEHLLTEGWDTPVAGLRGALRRS